MKNLVPICACAALVILGLIATWPTPAQATPSPAATVQYVNTVASNTLATAKTYTDNHVPEIDLTPYAKTADLPYRQDNFSTNVVWKTVISNGYFFVVAHTNLVSAGAN